MGLDGTDPTAYNKDSTARPDHKAPGPQLSCRSLFQTQVEFVNLSAIFRRAIREYANLPGSLDLVSRLPCRFAYSRFARLKSR